MYAIRSRWSLSVREGTTGKASDGGIQGARGGVAEDPDDELYSLGERCAETYMQADALHYEAMLLLAEFDERRGYEETPFPTTADWLAWRIGIQQGAARERVRTALALKQLPKTSSAMANGELSFTKVRAMTRVASPNNEEALLEFARAGSAANLERVVRGWKTMDRRSEVTAEEMRHRKRTFSAFVDEDGMVVVRGRLDPETGALLLRAVEAAGDVLFGEDAEVAPERRRADAVGLICARAMRSGFGENVESGSNAERYQVVLHVDTDTLEESQEPGQSELGDGTRVSAETSRRISCDCSLVRMTHAKDGSILDVGRRTRTIPPSLRRALEARDRGCRFPGCGSRFTDGHHIRHWADGGDTSLNNVMLLCPRHHRTVHEAGIRVCMDKDRKVVFFERNGNAVFDTPERSTPRMLPASPAPHPPSPNVLDSPGSPTSPTFPRKHSIQPRRPLDEEKRRHQPSHLTGAARWRRDSDIPWDLEARAWDALDEGVD